jgi:hypothetical protein
VKHTCDRDERSFIFVAAKWRFCSPSAST